MRLNPQPTVHFMPAEAIAHLTPIEIITLMIDLRRQLTELEQHIQTLKPAFFAACVALNTEKITLEQAIVSRRYLLGQSNAAIAQAQSWNRDRAAQ